SAGPREATSRGRRAPGCSCPVARVFTERQDQSVAVFHDHLPLLVHAILGTVDDLGAPAPQLGGQRIHTGDVEIGVQAALGSAGAGDGAVGAVEVHADLIAA